MRALCAILLILSAAIQVHAETVLIGETGRPNGHGLLVKHRTSCYVILPDHVAQELAGGAGVLPIATASPRVLGSAYTVFRRPEADIALAQVIGDMQGRCRLSFQDLPRDVSRLVAPPQRASLVRHDPQGGADNTEVEIVRLGWSPHCQTGETLVTGVLYQQLCFAVVGASAQDNRNPIAPGTSGAFLFAGDTPVAMVLATTSTWGGRALRMEEIVEPIDRFLNTRGVADRGNTRPAASGEVGFTVTGLSHAPISPGGASGAGPPALQDPDEPYEFRLDNGPAEIILELDGEEAKGVAAVVIESRPGDPPREVALQIDATPAGPARWDTRFSGELPADGSAVTIPINKFVRRVRLMVLSGWRPTVAIGRIAIVATD